MLTNYIKIAFRNLLRQKYFSAINLLGLSLGISCCILIVLWISDELRYDQFHVNGKYLYRVMENQFYTESDLQSTSATPGLLAEALKNEIPGITNSANILWEEEVLLTVGKESQKEKGRFASKEFLQMFTFPLSSGNPRTALAKSSAIVITEKLARHYFGMNDPMGKTMRVNNNEEFEVTGVLKEIPLNSSYRFDFLLTMEYYQNKNPWIKEWGNNGARTFVLLRPDASPEKINTRIKDFVKQKLDKANVELFLQPYTEMYLYSNFKNGVQEGGRIDYVRSFSIVAMVVLVIACINFMNLSTARSLKRAREIGIRKTNGASRKSLILQFMGEALVFSLLSTLVALFMVELLLPLFRQLTEKEAGIHYSDPVFLVTILSIAVVTGLLAGSYPALFLSSFNVVNVLKGTLKFEPRSAFFRKGLVVFQFCLAIVLVFCTIVIYRQIEFLKTQNLGFDRENLVYITVEGDLIKKMETFQQEVSRLPGIQSVTVASANPIEAGSSTVAVNWPGRLPDEQVLYTQLGVGYDYIKTMGLTMAEGRDFSRSMASDSSAYLVNEETVRKMKLKNPVGESITFWTRPGKIIGVIKDYHVNTLHNPIEPVILRLDPRSAWYLMARIEQGMTTKAIEALGELTTQLNPAYPFDYHFTDQTYEQQYKSETTVGKLADYFAFMAIFISCLGLLGLIIFSAEQRTKEIGVRKILGATARQVVVLLSKDYVLLVVIAFAISSPVAYYFMKGWLLNFAYRIDIGWTVFMAAGATSLLIALMTVGLQAWKAATANLVESMRSE